MWKHSSYCIDVVFEHCEKWRQEACQFTLINCFSVLDKTRTAKEIGLLSVYW